MTAVLDSVRDDRAAVDKAFSLLVAFGAEASTGVGVSELARRASLSKSTAYRVLGMLERNAMVERIGTDYRLGSRLHELGLAVYAPSHERVRDQLMPFLTELFDATRQTVHLAMLHGTDVVYLAKLYGHRNAVALSRVGGRLPAHCTAVGRSCWPMTPLRRTRSSAAGSPHSPLTRSQMATSWRVRSIACGGRRRHRARGEPP